MMNHLGIQALRPGPSGNPKAPDHANYDESKANPWPNLPDALTLNYGQKVTTAKMWWQQRRPQIVHDFDEYIYGVVPNHVPAVTWSVAASPVWTLLGAPGLSTDHFDYHTAPMPPVNDGLLGGKLAWRQDDGGHTDAPNMKYFIRWVNKFVGYPDNH